MAAAEPEERTICPGCGAHLAAIEGPVHDYMTSSPACFAHFTEVLAYEYSDARLRLTHRLTVDTYAVQHPGDQSERRQIQSVGLHLARLCLQMDGLRSPSETNDIMLGLGAHKASLKPLRPPTRFSLTISDVNKVAGTDRHAEMVRDWAAATWQDWAEYHSYIREWTDQHWGRAAPRR